MNKDKIDEIIMKPTVNWQKFVMTALFAVGLLYLIAMPDDENEWFAMFIIGKGIAAACFYAMNICASHWENGGNKQEFH